ncbi:related to exosome complex exonuclease [Cephalotrichum gorgonifer]|uniref:Ribosomal RNA-processing protein 43 n=1 Tax=Cephalotrichum gorgonifer TaxID=2041049 RepID=A0AAE8MTP1_9PEZI|nr:related to exosome complex exonuclease [Cephalotrichum gorgonifer]
MTTEPKGLPRATFAKLSPHPYLLANLEPSAENATPARSNGRAPSSARPPTVNISSLSHANGSALVRLGDTTVICGVRAETLLTTDIPNFRPDNRKTELAEYDLLVPNIELATGCSPQFLPGQPPSVLAQTLSARVYSLLHASKLVSPESLRIWYTPSAGDDSDDDDKMQEDGEDDGENGEAEAVLMGYWVLYIDMFFISFDGNAFDAAWAAIVAALRNTRLPRASWDADREMILCSGEDRVPLATNGLPIACTAVVFTGKDTDRPGNDGKYWLLLDPDRLEESLCDETVTAVVDCSRGGGAQTQVLSISKHGGTTASGELLRGYLAVAEKRWAEFHKAITASS